MYYICIILGGTGGDGNKFMYVCMYVCIYQYVFKLMFVCNFFF